MEKFEVVFGDLCVVVEAENIRWAIELACTKLNLPVSSCDEAYKVPSSEKENQTYIALDIQVERDRETLEKIINAIRRE